MKYRVYITGNNLREEFQNYCNLLDEWRYLHTKNISDNLLKLKPEEFISEFLDIDNIKNYSLYINSNNEIFIDKTENYS